MSDVYFASMKANPGDSIPSKLTRLMRAAHMDELQLEDKLVAVKTHFGEYGNVTYLKPAYLRTVSREIRELGGKPYATDCNTLYVGMRSNGIDHLRCAAENGFNHDSCGCDIVIGDGIRGTDEVSLPVPKGGQLKEAHIGRGITDADVMITLTHAKGCLATGFGGVLKNVAMGCASRAGKAVMHREGKAFVKSDLCVGCRRCAKSCAQNAIEFDESGKAHINDNCLGCFHCYAYCGKNAISAKSAKSFDSVQWKIAEYAAAVVKAIPCFHLAIAIDITPSCDCFTDSDLPIVPNVGMFASFDPVALDQAIVDRINASSVVPNSVLEEKMTDENSDYFDTIGHGSHWRVCFNHAEELGVGERAYKLIEVH